VTADKLADRAVTAKHVTEKAIAAEHLADGSVTPEKLSFRPVETNSIQGITLQQFGFVPFRLAAGKKSTDVTIRLNVPYVDPHYCLIAMTNQAGCCTSLKYTSRTYAVVNVFRTRFGQETSGVLQWIAVGEKGTALALNEELPVVLTEEDEEPDLDPSAEAETEEAEDVHDEDFGQPEDVEGDVQGQAPVQRAATNAARGQVHSAQAAIEPDAAEDARGPSEAATGSKREDPVPEPDGHPVEANERFAENEPGAAHSVHPDETNQH
jgi:hypothetical protein